MGIKKIFYFESALERVFDGMMRGLVFLLIFLMVYLLLGLTGMVILTVAEGLFFLWNRYEMRHASGG